MTRQTGVPTRMISFLADIINDASLPLYCIRFRNLHCYDSLLYFYNYCFYLSVYRCSDFLGTAMWCFVFSFCRLFSDYTGYSLCFYHCCTLFDIRRPQSVRDTSLSFHINSRYSPSQYNHHCPQTQNIFPPPAVFRYFWHRTHRHAPYGLPGLAHPFGQTGHRVLLTNLLTHHPPAGLQDLDRSAQEYCQCTLQYSFPRYKQVQSH